MNNKEFDFNNKTILITGGAGFIGSHIVDALVNSGKFDSIRIIDNLSAESHDKPYLNKSNIVRCWAYDIGNYDIIKDLFIFF